MRAGLVLGGFGLLGIAGCSAPPPPPPSVSAPPPSPSAITPRSEACLRVEPLRALEHILALQQEGKLDRLARQLRTADRLCPEEAHLSLEQRFLNLQRLGDHSELQEMLELVKEPELRRRIQEVISQGIFPKNSGQAGGLQEQARIRMELDRELRAAERKLGATMQISLDADWIEGVAFHDSGELGVYFSDGSVFTIDFSSEKIGIQGAKAEIPFAPTMAMLLAARAQKCPPRQECVSWGRTPGYPFVIKAAFPEESEREFDSSKIAISLRERSTGALRSTLRLEKGLRSTSLRAEAIAQDGAWYAKSFDYGGFYLWSTSRGGKSRWTSSILPSDYRKIPPGWGHIPLEFEENFTIRDMSFSGDGRWLIATLVNGSIRLFSTSSTQTRTKEISGGRAREIAVADDGRVFVALGPGLDPDAPAPDPPCIELDLATLKTRSATVIPRDYCEHLVSNKGQVVAWTGRTLGLYKGGELHPIKLPRGPGYGSLALEGDRLLGVRSPATTAPPFRLEGASLFHADARSPVASCEHRALHALQLSSAAVALLCEAQDGQQRVYVHAIASGARLLSLQPVATPSRASFLAVSPLGLSEPLGLEEEIQEWRERLLCSVKNASMKLSLCEERLSVKGLWKGAMSGNVLAEEAFL